REQPWTEKVVLREKRRRTNAVVSHREIDLGAALRQVNRVSEVVFFSKGADRLQQLGRGGFGERGCREYAAGSLLRAVPRGEQIVDALQALVSQPGGEPGRLALGEPLRRHRSGNVLAVA